jgi:hypothetical protein
VVTFFRRALLAASLLAIAAHSSTAFADDAADADGGASDDAAAPSGCVDTHTLETPAGLRTDCAPYNCTNASCLRACDTAADCVVGRICNQSKCVFEEAISPPESSCAIGRAPTSSRSDAFLFVAATVALFVRSRPRRRSQTIV